MKARHVLASFQPKEQPRVSHDMIFIFIYRPLFNPIWQPALGGLLLVCKNALIASFSMSPVDAIN